MTRVPFSDPPLPELSDAEFNELSDLVATNFGLRLSHDKRREIKVKLTEAIRSLGDGSIRGFLDAIKKSPEALQEVVDRVTIGESYFFRNRPHFVALRRRIIPELIEQRRALRRLTIWCAGCAAGEEPYSLAILLKEEFPELADWRITIVGSDINNSFLERAAAGVYTRWSFRGVEQSIIDRYFERVDDRRFRLRSEIKRDVRLEWFNIVELGQEPPAFVGPVDLLFCRNVLIYFPFELANRIAAALGETLVPGGFLLVGHSEAFPALGGLEAIYSDATYFYRRLLPGEQPARASIPGRTWSIPGIGVGEVEPRPSQIPRPPSVPPPPRRPSVIPAPLPSVAPPAPTEAELVAQRLDEARELADGGDFDGALALLDELLSGTGQLDYRVHFVMALAADQHGRPADAIRSLRQAIFLNKELVVAHYYQGVICERENDLPTAARCFRNVARMTGQLPTDQELDEAGGVTAGRLGAIARERIREVTLADQRKGGTHG